MSVVGQQLAANGPDVRVEVEYDCCSKKKNCYGWFVTIFKPELKNCSYLDWDGEFELAINMGSLGGLIDDKDYSQEIEEAVKEGVSLAKSSCKSKVE